MIRGSVLLALLSLSLYYIYGVVGQTGSDVADPRAGTGSSSITGEGDGEEEEEPTPEQLLGPSLMAWSSRARGEAMIDTTGNILKNASYIGIFFSASYCGPCKQFIPLLEQFYNKMKGKGASFEVVWVNSDPHASKSSFLEYYRLMPWPAVPFEAATDALMRTANRYSLSGIPHLVIVHGDDCSVITLDGRMKVLEDPNGLEFPWGSKARLLIPMPRSIEKFLTRRTRALKTALLQAIQPKSLMYAAQSIAISVLKLVGAIASKLGSILFA